ncbi:MAG: diguanylate cyclase [Chloroflexi bacterium]|nr:diguanylate cyclase [Chloroflexota bacterium]
MNFSPAFFVMLTLAALLGVFLPFLMSINVYVGLWAVVYLFVWYFYFRVEARDIQVIIIQFLLVEISAGLSYYVGKQIGQIDSFVEGLSIGAFPNRTFDMDSARDKVDAELTRSRRYHRPLSALVLQFEHEREKKQLKQYEIVERDLLKRFAFAKMGQIINEYARQTDLVIRDRTGHFIILCPETDYQNSTYLAERIQKAVSLEMGVMIKWGAAAFPDEALTFDDLVYKARERLEKSMVAALNEAALVDKV